MRSPRTSEHIFAATVFAGSVAALLGACSGPEGTFDPAGAAAPSTLEQERFVKRLHLDLTGLKPDDTRVAAALERLARDGNTAETRAAMAGELVATPEFARLWVEEVEIDAFGGSRREDVYDLFCFVFLTIEPECQSCPMDVEDFCACDCPTVSDLREERELLRRSQDDFAAGTASSEIDRRIAASLVFQFNGGSGEGIADAMFTGFLGRPPEAEEIRNVRAMVLGDGIPNMAGILFHEVGHTYPDVVDIVFSSEVYREAAVNRVIFRYLGRYATPAELSHFVAGLDPAAPDIRPIVVSVTSSREYFEQ
jgi:hypothetical protein